LVFALIHCSPILPDQIEGGNKMITGPAEYQCLWTEVLPSHELGRLEITRASNLEFNNTTQHWEVKDRKGKVRLIAKSRSACLGWEHTSLRPD
jgi:hypothetical protein